MKTFEQIRKDMLNEIGIRQKHLQRILSQFDMALQDALHFLEIEQCDAVAMVKVAKKIKELRMKRRSIKIELEKLQSVTDSITQNVARFDNKTYTYKTETMQRIQRTYRTK